MLPGAHATATEAADPSAAGSGALEGQQVVALTQSDFLLLSLLLVALCYVAAALLRRLARAASAPARRGTAPKSD